MTTFSLSFGGGDTLLGLLYAAVQCTKVYFDMISSGDHHCDVTDINMDQYHVAEQSKPTTYLAGQFLKVALRGLNLLPAVIYYNAEIFS